MKLQLIERVDKDGVCYWIYKDDSCVAMFYNLEEAQSAYDKIVELNKNPIPDKVLQTVEL